MKNIKNLYFALPKQHQIIITSCALVLLLLVIVPQQSSEQAGSSADGEFKVGHRYQIAMPEQASNTAASPAIQLANKPIETVKIKQQPATELVSNIGDNAAQLHWQSVKVKSGDSLAKIFKRNGLNATTTHKVITAQGEDSKILKKLNVGDMLRIGKDDKGGLVSLEYPFSKTQTLFVNLQSQQYHAHKESKSVEIRETIAQGIIKSNFWNAGSAAGLNDGQIINLANVFGWDIDFALDIRKGDSFNIIYEKQYVEGDFIGTGKILAAEFINQGETFQAIRFTDDEYYSPNGKSMRKAFLRAPVNFRYISSNFKPKRFHPIQKRWKAHNGTDYSAKKGTPVVAAGNGKVTHSTYNKYNGHYVFIQHGNGIVTKYLHFSKRAVKKGQRVKQGQVIGYVGSTGMSQAPHLHYEFLLNGVHRNPRTVKLPDAKPISSKYRQAFDAIAKQRLVELSGSRQAMLSMQERKGSAD
ncbi:MAG: peptidoglycan DD-metalloendopeptidase family protein [Cognaticolwellia sp.]